MTARHLLIVGVATAVSILSLTGCDNQRDPSEASDGAPPTLTVEDRVAAESVCRDAAPDAWIDEARVEEIEAVKVVDGDWILCHRPLDGAPLEVHPLSGAPYGGPSMWLEDSPLPDHCEELSDQFLTFLIQDGQAFRARSITCGGGGVAEE